MTHLHREGYVTAEVRRKHKDGRELQLWITATLVRSDEGRILNYLRVFTDISPLKDTQRQLEHLVHIDPLTGLPNRRLFGERIEDALHRARRTGLGVALLFLDLDGFKHINDTHGHHVGDQLLQQAAVKLAGCIRASDSLFRLGGESMKVGTSIGIALYPADGGDSIALIHSADAAMYRAKNAGGNRHALSPCDKIVSREPLRSASRTHAELGIRSGSRGADDGERARALRISAGIRS